MAEKRLDRGDQLLNPVGFPNVTISTGVESITYICHGGASGKDQDLGIWGEISDSSCCQNSVETREPAAEYRNIGSPIMPPLG